MASKLLQGIGVVAILGLVGGAFAALVVVKQRIHVSIAAEEAAMQRGPDPIELLRADVGVIAGDLAAFNESLGARLQELHDSLESSASERERTLAARVEALEAKLGALQSGATQSSAALAAAIAALAESTAQLRIDAANPAAAAPELATEVPSAPALDAPPALVAPAQPETAGAVESPAAPASPPKKGFLAFQLPSSVFAFDQRQRFAIVPALSRVGFDAKSTLHDFSGVSSKVDGSFTVNLAKAAEKPVGTITVEAASLDTGLADRDVDMRKTLSVEQFKTIRFEWSGFSATTVDAKAMTLSGSATGRLTIRGKSHDVSMPVKVSVDASKRVAIDGELAILLSDYDVSPPSQIGVIKVEDELKLWIALRARLVGVAKEGE